MGLMGQTERMGLQDRPVTELNYISLDTSISYNIVDNGAITYTDLVFTNVVLPGDVSNLTYNNTTGVMTALKTGVYQFNCVVRFNFTIDPDISFSYATGIAVRKNTVLQPKKYGGGNVVIGENKLLSRIYEENITGVIALDATDEMQITVDTSLNAGGSQAGVMTPESMTMTLVSQ